MQDSPFSTKKALTILSALVFCSAPQCVFAQSFNYISPVELKQRLESASIPFLLDIQVEKDYAQHHLRGTVATYAYPAKSEDERAKLRPAIQKILATNQEVVIICPAGGQGAKNAYTYLKEQGVPENRMRILEKGQRGWPYPEMLTATQ